MIFVIGLLLLIVCLLWWFSSRNTKWLKHGRFYRRANCTINQHCYYMEEVKFDSYRQALGAFGKTVEELCEYGQVVNMKYDLYDWTFAYFQFEGVTVAVRHHRPLNRIQLLQSKSSVTIDAIEKDFLVITE